MNSSSSTSLAGDASPSDSERLKTAVERAAELLPIHGPITAFVYLNTLQALEDLPFEEGLLKGASLFGVQPYLTEDRYREKLARNRIRPEDLSIVVRRDLADRANLKLCSLTTPFDAIFREGSMTSLEDLKISPWTTLFDIRLAMLQYPLQTGPVEELRWFVAETDALSRFRDDAPQAARAKIVEETKRWVMRDLRDGGEAQYRGSGQQGAHDQHLHDDLIRRFGESSIEHWTPSTWEAFSLRLLWRVCRDGARP